jgi:SOS-response transcriptional repressor LexA
LARGLELGLQTERAICVAAGVNPDLLRHIRVGRVRNTTTDNLEKIADRLQVSTDWLLGRVDQATTVEFDTMASQKWDRIELVGEVQAGAWREAEQLCYDDRLNFPVPVDQRYPRIRRFALKVLGNSMDLLYPEGTILICAAFEEINRQPRHGDIVIVQRMRQWATEATCKELIVRNDEVILQPRSSDKKHKPIKLPGSALLTAEGTPHALVPAYGDAETMAEKLADQQDPTVEDVTITALVTGFYGLQ